jgi:hypothetical protein
VQARGRERQAQTDASESVPVRFVEAVVPRETSVANPGRNTLRVQLAAGAHLEITDRPQALLAAELLRALANSNAAASC